MKLKFGWCNCLFFIPVWHGGISFTIIDLILNLIYGYQYLITNHLPLVELHLCKYSLIVNRRSYKQVLIDILILKIDFRYYLRTIGNICIFHNLNNYKYITFNRII